MKYHDHSLLLQSGDEISPNNVDIGAKLLHNYLPRINYKNITFDNQDDAATYCLYLSNNDIKYNININLQNKILVNITNNDYNYSIIIKHIINYSN